MLRSERVRTQSVGCSACIWEGALIPDEDYGTMHSLPKSRHKAHRVVQPADRAPHPPGAPAPPGQVFLPRKSRIAQSLCFEMKIRMASLRDNYILLRFYAEISQLLLLREAGSALGRSAALCVQL